LIPSQEKAISEFRRAIEALRATGVIRSHRYLGDLGEFLCADTFGIDLERNLRAVGIDGRRNELRVQIKYHGGKNTAIDVGDPNSYDELYVVLGPGSVFRPHGYADDFLVYLISSDQVRAFESKEGKYWCTQNRLGDEPTRHIALLSNPH
jgi:hypothetical protein